MSVKSQQVAKPAVARPVRAAQGVTAQVRGFAGNHTLMRKQQEADRVADEQLQGGRSKAESRTGMPWQLKAGLEALSGMDLSGIRIHRTPPNQTNSMHWRTRKDRKSMWVLVRRRIYLTKAGMRCSRCRDV